MPLVTTWRTTLAAAVSPASVTPILLLIVMTAAARPASAARGPAAEGPAPGTAVAVLAGGCFWGVEAVFERLSGVSDVVSGFAGGQSWTAYYPVVGLGVTGHAESVQITYDPRQITFETLLDVFFTVAHDPTQRNRQGPDFGPQYRSVIFYADEAQRRVAEAYIASLAASKAFDKPVVTTLEPFEGFYPAGAEHQDFVARNPTYPYVVANDLPKLDRLARRFPELVAGASARRR